MAWASKKQYAILMSSEEGKDLAEKLGEMEQEEFNKKFSELLGKSGQSTSESKKEDNQKAKQQWLKENDYEDEDDVDWWEKDDNADEYEYTDEDYKDLKGQMYFQNEQGWTNNGKTLPNLTDEQLKERLEKASGGGKFKNVMIESYKGDNIVDIAMEDSDGQLVYGTYDRNTGFTKLEPQGRNAKKSGGTYGEFRSQIQEKEVKGAPKSFIEKTNKEHNEAINNLKKHGINASNFTEDDVETELNKLFVLWEKDDKNPKYQEIFDNLMKIQNKLYTDSFVKEAPYGYK